MTLTALERTLHSQHVWAEDLEPDGLVRHIPVGAHHPVCLCLNLLQASFRLSISPVSACLAGVQAHNPACLCLDILQASNSLSISPSVCILERKGRVAQGGLVRNTVCLSLSSV